MAYINTQFNQARAGRRSGGLNRLANEYKQQIAAMTDDYAKQFSSYQERVNATMAPYEAAMRQYQTVDQPQYQTRVAEYNTRLEAYRAQLADLEANPLIERQGEARFRGMTGNTRTLPYTYYEPRPIPTFTEKMPELPAAPKAPEIESFDSSQFDAKRQLVSTTMQREVGERRASRMNAVRRSSRGLLQGAA
jgi:hypothetical protein